VGESAYFLRQAFFKTLCVSVNVTNALSGPPPWLFQPICKYYTLFHRKSQLFS
jgi:hypothetical protein